VVPSNDENIRRVHRLEQIHKDKCFEREFTAIDKITEKDISDPDRVSALLQDANDVEKLTMQITNHNTGRVKLENNRFRLKDSQHVLEEGV
jgi:hypothetical protein